MTAAATNKPIALAVDDSLIIQQMVQRALDSDFKVLVADNAVEALSVIYHQPISALLLDITMPGIDGFELCRTVRSVPRFQKLPIMMLTSHRSAADRAEAKSAGASGYMTKPFDAQELRQALTRLLARAA
ncbi:response regulator [Leptolyngbya iicbica]|uniref:Response regulator n=2 Tax=Cyanophyceae TaxID=3028117 RepID=A0A4Q7E0V3_9CYAN|nr:response regulator [Leptolyngbya sp. LK]RZM75089.1 response regulator [Leptolyngbya sp. LK]